MIIGNIGSQWSYCIFNIQLCMMHKYNYQFWHKYNQDKQIHNQKYSKHKILIKDMIDINYLMDQNMFSNSHYIINKYHYHHHNIHQDIQISIIDYKIDSLFHILNIIQKNLKYTKYNVKHNHHKCCFHYLQIYHYWYHSHFHMLNSIKMFRIYKFNIHFQFHHGNLSRSNDKEHTLHSHFKQSSRMDITLNILPIVDYLN